MKHHAPWVMGACALIMIVCVLLAGCTFLQPATPPAPTTTPGTGPVVEQTPEKQVPESCDAFGGTICPSGQVCDGTLVKSSDSSRCCDGTCVVPKTTTAPAATTAASTTATTAPATTTATSTVTAVPPEYIPSPTSPGVTPGTTLPVQTPEAQVSLTCSAFGGHICLSDETCSGSMVQSSDSDRCCAGTCTMVSSGGTPVPTTEAPVRIPGKTCAEIGGNICVAPQTCDAALVITDDTSACCAGSCV